ncbi:MAG TPA: tol-pal system protein YbgF [Rhodanobacteraceae bacterium]|nr:tol-pal system protein YbgF [Rhodanobacteraceae bacterium]
MKLPVANQPWAAKAVATAAVCAVVALWGGGPVHAQSMGITPARQYTAATQTQTPGDSASDRGGNLMALFNQVQMLKQQNRELLGQVEQLRHQLDQIKQINKEQYIALDTRIKRLESSGQSAPAQAASSTPPSAQGNPAASASTPASAATSAPATSASTALAGNADAQQAYDTAFDALRSGNFVKSSRDFRAFIEQYPHDKLTPNAWYWLGESYYITQNYKQAESAFDAVLKQFPQSGKAPGALLKKGYCQYALKQIEAARATLQSVIAKYPDSSVANLAKQRLEDMRLQQQLK